MRTHKQGFDMWKITLFNERHHIIFLLLMHGSIRSCSYKKVKTLAFYSLFALRRRAQKLILGLGARDQK